MRSYLIGFCALGLWAAAELPAAAAWDNVFQPTLFHRWRNRQTTSNYVAAPVVAYSAPVVATAAPVVAAPTCNTCNSPPPAQPCQQCQTSYTQRCYYQPVTTYTTQSYYEPVTTYRTSYYYEPVTSYRYSCYVDPCTGCPQQVAQPVTSYQLRAQTCPTQSWVQRCAQVPVQSYQKVCYWQPQTTCCTTTQGAPIFAGGGEVAAPAAPAVVPAPAAPPAVSVAPSISQPGTAGPPSVSAERTPGSGMSNPSTNPMYNLYYPPQTTPPPAARPSSVPSMPPATWSPSPGTARPAAVQPPPPPPVKLERIVVGPDTRVEGQVVRSDNAPKANAKLLFVSAAGGQRATATANTAGRFNVQLPPGSWLVYLHGADDLPVYHSRLDVTASRAAAVTLVSATR